MNLTHIVVGILATWGITEWYSHEEVLHIRNKAIERRNTGNNPRWNQLLTCVFCTSHWIALFVSILITYFHHNLILTFLYWWVFVRCANFLNDFFYGCCRTPGNILYEQWKKDIIEQQTEEK